MGSASLPPIGLKPKSIHDALRFHEVQAAIFRYIEGGYKIPVEWIEEYNELITKG